MLLKTQIFELCPGKYQNLRELAQAMGISLSQVYGVKHGQHGIGEEFIIGALKAFPEYGIGDLFYFTA